MSAPKVDRNRRMVAAVRREPSLSWRALANRYGVSVAAIRAIVLREMPAEWRKPRPVTWHECAATGCTTRFRHHNGYSGRNCEEHRR